MAITIDPTWFRVLAKAYALQKLDSAYKYISELAPLADEQIAAMRIIAFSIMELEGRVSQDEHYQKYAAYNLRGIVASP
jgi:hypothetical protein